MQCKKCSSVIEDGKKYCPDCGAKLINKDEKLKENKVKKIVKNEKKGNTNIVAILAFIFAILSIFTFSLFSPIGLILSIIALVINKKYNRKLKGLAIAATIISSLYFVMFMTFCTNIMNAGNEDKSTQINTSDYYKTTDKNTSSASNDKLNEIHNQTLRDNFVKACEQIKINPTEIKNLKQKDDWNSGPRYTFEYKNEKFILYALSNGDVSSITIANVALDKIYLDGYEPLNVNDFIFGISEETTLRLQAEEKLREYTKYPSTAKFNWTGYSYSRRYDIYQISGTFKAKNSMGVEKNHSFIIEFRATDGNYSVIYLNVNNENYIGSDTQFKELDRKELQLSDQNNPVDNDTITLKEGTIGAYGKKDVFDGEENIRYYIPAGTYKVEAITKNAGFYIETIELHKEDGYDTATTIRTIRLANTGDTDEFNISEDQCISLIMYTQVKLTKID